MAKRNISPAMSAARGRVAALSIFHEVDAPELIAARRQLRFVKLSEFLDRELGQQPSLSAEQAEELASRLREGAA